MKRFYVVPLSVYKGSTTANGVTVMHRDLFHSKSGSHYLPLSGGLILVSIDFNSDYSQSIWHNHPDVALLPHPQIEPTMTLACAVSDTTRKLQQAHVDALACLGIDGTHNVIDVHNASSATHPLVRVQPLNSC